MPYVSSKPPAQATADTIARSGRRLTSPITTRITIPVVRVVHRIPRGDSITLALTLLLDSDGALAQNTGLPTRPPVVGFASPSEGGRHDANDRRGAGVPAARACQGPSLDHALAGPDVPLGVP